MKKISYLLFAAALTFGLAACTKTDNPGSPTVEPTDGQVIVKEINVGGSVKASTGKGAYTGCKGIILYNNGGKAVTLSNFGIAFCAPWYSVRSAAARYRRWP